MAYDLSGPDNAAQAQGALPNPQVTGQASAVPPSLTSGAAVGPPPVAIPGNYTLSGADHYVSPFAAPTAADNVLNTKRESDGFDPQQGFADIAKRSMAKIAEHDEKEHPESKLASFIEGMGAGQGGILGGLSNIISSQRAAKERDYQGALKNLNQVVSNVGATHIKSAIADQQAALKAREAQIKDDHNKGLETARARMLEIKEKHEATIADHYKNNENLQKYGIDTKAFGADQLRQQHKEFFDAQEQRLRDAAQVSAALRIRGQDQQAAQFQTKIKQDAEKAAAEFGMKVNSYNTNIQNTLNKHDANGNLIYHDENGKPLLFTPLKFDGLSQPEVLTPGTDVDSIMQKYMGQPQQPAPQAPQQDPGQPAVAAQPARQRPQLQLTDGPEPSKGAEIAKPGDATGVAAITAQRRAEFNSAIKAGHSEDELRQAIMRAYIKKGHSREEAFKLSEQF